MRNNKIILSLILIIALLSVESAFADKPKSVSINDIREEVADGWHQTYEAHGRTIVVDVDIQVPDVSSIPIVRIGFPPAMHPIDDSIQDVSIDQTGMVYIVESEPGVYQGNGDSYEITGQDARAENSPLSSAEAKAFFLNVIKQYENQTGPLELAPCSELAQSRRYLVESRVLNPNKPTTKMGTYYFDYNQLFHGIPYMVSYPFELSVLPKERMESPRGLISGFVASESDYIISLCQASETGVLADDSPLVPFSEVKKEYEKLIAAGLIREVYDVRLGYYCYVDPKNVGTSFVLQPIWRLRGMITQRSSDPDPVLAELTPEYTRTFSGQYAIIEANSGERLGERSGWEYANMKLWK